MAKSDVEEWLIFWASDNLHEGYTDSPASLEQAATDCLSTAEEDGLSTDDVLAAANGDLAAWLRDFKEESSEGD